MGQSLISFVRFCGIVVSSEVGTHKRPPMTIVMSMMASLLSAIHIEDGASLPCLPLSQTLPFVSSLLVYWLGNAPMHLHRHTYIIFLLTPATDCPGYIRTDRPGKAFAESPSRESQSCQALRAETRILRSCALKVALGITVDGYTIIATAAR